MTIKILEDNLTSTITGRLQTTIPARLARKHGIKTGMRLEWVETGDDTIITARILPDPLAGLREAQAIAAKNRRAAAKLAKTFETEHAWQRENGPMI
jgi:bifunctional DNA-binding transcriptional regulator/antitoxin component of YhaV-PrlF toxin-antitoxin module